MAEADFSEYDQRYPTAASERRGTTIMHWVGALVSIGLIVGLAVWGYKLAMRDITGIPVVRALDGPMRVQPDDPGGERARHQGLAVNRVQAEGEAAPTAETLILAPAPIELIAADQPITDDRPEPRVVATTEPAPEIEPVQASLTEEMTDPGQLDQAAQAETIAAALAEGVTPLESAVEQAVEEANAEAEPVANPDAIPASVPGVAISLRPPARPELDLANYQRTAATTEVEPDALAAGPTIVDPDTIPTGTRLVQLGAFDTAEIAAEEWERLNNAFADYFAGKAQVIQRASSGGRDFYRLRAMGFADLSDARRFCSVLLARNAACIPVSIR